MSQQLGRLSGSDAEKRPRVSIAASVSVFDNLDAIEADWRALFETVAVSPYQKYDVQSSWLNTIGRQLGLEPFIVISRNKEGRVVALLPFAIATRGPIRIARFIGNRECNFSLGLFSPEVSNPDFARNLLVTAALQSSRPPDLYYLTNMPRRFDDVVNPLADDSARDSASNAYGANLPNNVDDLSARVSKDTRKKLRKKEARLTEMGLLAYEHCPTGARARFILDAMIAQKSARLTAMGVTPLDQQPGMPAFLERATDDGILELHALTLGDRVIASYAGFTQSGRFSAMLNSFDTDEEIARSSPGDLLLHALMKNLVSRGVRRFDLGAGEARYKQAVCDETIELCEAVIPVSRKGAFLAPLLTQALRLKRHIKKSPTLSRTMMQLRRLTA